MSSAVVSAIIGIGSAVASTVATSQMMKKNKPEEVEEPKEVKVDDESALRRAQDMARKRKGFAANMLSDPTTSTAGSVGTKTALGQ